jgi:hypothetical protein
MTSSRSPIKLCCSPPNDFQASSYEIRPATCSCIRIIVIAQCGG